MARGLLSRMVKQGIKASLTAQGRVGQVGQRVSAGWNNLVAEASAEHAADRTRRAAEAAESASISTATERLEQAAYESEHARAANEAGLVRDLTSRPRATTGPADDASVTVDTASERLEQAGRKGRRKRDEASGGVIRAAEVATDGDAPPRTATT